MNDNGQPMNDGSVARVSTALRRLGISTTPERPVQLDDPIGQQFFDHVSRQPDGFGKLEDAIKRLGTKGFAAWLAANRGKL